MRRLLALSLVLGAAACGSAGVRVGSEAKSTAVLPPPDPVVVTAPLLPPDGAVILHYADPQCPPSVSTVTLPDRVRTECVMKQARLAALRVVKAKQEAPGQKSPCFWIRDRGAYESCLTVAAEKLPAVSYGLSARYVTGLNAGKPFQGCAAGVSGDPIFVSLARPDRVLALAAWESANSFLWLTYDRVDLTDGPLVADATNAALAACGGN